jgi:hypothetical protein
MVGWLAAAPARAQDPRPWSVIAEAGRSSLHEDDDPRVGALRLARSFGEGRRFRAHAGFVGSSYFVLDGGAEVALCTACRAAPFLGAGIGLMGEDEFVGAALHLNAGVEVALGSRAALRLAGQLGRHGGQRGPHAITLGIAVHFGSRR